MRVLPTALLGCLSVAAAHAQDEGTVSRAGSVSVRTDFSFYEWGEAVTITLRNDGPRVIWTQIPAFQVFGGGREVFAENGIFVHQAVLPGRERSWTWTQRDRSGRLVPRGRYNVNVQFLSRDRKTVTAIGPAFDILPKSTGGIVTTTGNATAFPEGASVPVHVINRLGSTVSLGGYRIKDRHGRVVVDPLDTLPPGIIMPAVLEDLRTGERAKRGPARLRHTRGVEKGRLLKPGRYTFEIDAYVNNAYLPLRASFIVIPLVTPGRASYSAGHSRY